jgi:hypothetical protein
MRRSVEHILSRWLLVAFCALAGILGLVFGMALLEWGHWLVSGDRGLGGQSPLHASINGKLDSDPIRYEFSAEQEHRLLAILVHLEAPTIVDHYSVQESDTDCPLAKPIHCGSVGAHYFQSRLLVREQLAERDGYLSVGVAQNHLNIAPHEARPVKSITTKNDPARLVKGHALMITASQATHETTSSTLTPEGGFPALERIT